MGGRPFLQSIVAKIKANGGDDWVFDQMSDGLPVGKIAEQLDCSRRMLYDWRDMQPSRKERWTLALKHGTHAKIEKAEGELDKLAEDPDATPTRARLLSDKIGHARWLASKLDKETFGDGPTTQINLSVGDLHINALKAMSQQLPAPKTLIAETIEEGEDEE